MGATGYLLKNKTGRIRHAMTGAIEHALLRGENRQAKGKLGRRSAELDALFQIVNIFPGSFDVGRGCSGRLGNPEAGR